MTQPHLLDRSITSVGQMLRDGRLTAVDLVEAHLHAAVAGASQVARFTLLAAAAQGAARRADAERLQGLDRGPLHGIPCALYDPADTMLSTLVERLGGIVLGQPDVSGTHDRSARDRLAGPASSCAASVANGVVRFALAGEDTDLAAITAGLCGVPVLATDSVRPGRKILVFAASIPDTALVFDALSDGLDPANNPEANMPAHSVIGLEIGLVRDVAIPLESMVSLDDVAARLSLLGVRVTLFQFAQDDVVPARFDAILTTSPLPDYVDRAGHPILAFPADFSKSGLTFAAQLIGHVSGEAMLCRIAGAFEAATDFAAIRPTNISFCPEPPKTEHVHE